MADNTDEDYADNILPEKLPDEIITTKDTATIYTNQETENMEVHKHPHHVREKKKFGEYLLEFFMIFLAVFLGFLAEYQLEHYLENQRAKEFAVSLYRDLKTDTAIFNNTIERLNICSKKIDTLIEVLGNSGEVEKKKSSIYYLSIYAFIFPTSTPTQSTLQQLINSGALRYLKDNVLVDSIKGYNNSVQFFNSFSESSSAFNIEFRKYQSEIIEINPLINFLDSSILIFDKSGENISDTAFFSSSQLLTNEPLQLKKYANWCALKKFYFINSIVLCKQLYLQANGVLRLLNKQYHMDTKF